MLTDAAHARSARAAPRRRTTSIPGSAPTCARCAARWMHATAVPADLVEALVEGVLGLRDGVARGAAGRRLRRACCRRCAEVLDLVARGRGGQGGAARHVALRRAARRVRARRQHRRASTALFDELAGFLPGLIDGGAGSARQARPAPLPLDGPVPDRRAARSSGVKLMERARLRFRITAGSMSACIPSAAARPTTCASPRATTRADFSRALMGVLHETGHALYERGLPRDWRRQPVGDARGMALHESQSLLMEMQACRSPRLRRLRRAAAARGLRRQRPGLGRRQYPSPLHPACERSFIRVDADEVTYPAHVILRYRLERAMHRRRPRARRPAGGLERRHEGAARHRAARRSPGLPAGHPLARRRLGLFPDLHAGRDDGGAALRCARKRADPASCPAIGKGDFAPLLAWLRANVHGKGSPSRPPRSSTQATGRRSIARLPPPSRSALHRRLNRPPLSCHCERSEAIQR